MELIHKDIVLPDVPCGDIRKKAPPRPSVRALLLKKVAGWPGGKKTTMPRPVHHSMFSREFREGLYKDIQQDRIGEWHCTVREFEKDPDDFYNAWWYLDNHPAFWTYAHGPGSHRRLDPAERHHEKHLLHDYGITRCVRMDVHKVNAITRSTQGEPQTDTEVWIELGQAPWPPNPDEHNQGEATYHDHMLDCGGPTVEAAIVKAARNVWEVYGNDRRVCDAPYDERSYLPVLSEDEEEFDAEDSLDLRYGNETDTWDSDVVGPHAECGQEYHARAAEIHVVPCKFCKSPAHPGCGHTR